MAFDKQYRINRDIKALKVRLIDAQGNNQGVVPIRRAADVARHASLDLVEIVPNSTPPVCRVMDYGKFKFSESKKAAAARKKQKKIHVKEIKFRPATDEGDYKIKMNRIVTFLSNGDKVKVTIRFRGREMAHRELGMDVLKRVQAELLEIAQTEQFPKMEGRQMVMVIAPKK